MFIKGRPNGFRGVKVSNDEKTKCSTAIFGKFPGINLYSKLTTVKKLKLLEWEINTDSYLKCQINCFVLFQRNAYTSFTVISLLFFKGKA